MGRGELDGPGGSVDEAVGVLIGAFPKRNIPPLTVKTAVHVFILSNVVASNVFDLPDNRILPFCF